MDCVQQILSVIDELKKNNAEMEIVYNASQNNELKEMAKKAMNIQCIAISKLEEIFKRTQDEKEILYILKTVKKRSAEMTSIVLSKSRALRNNTEEKIETRKIVTLKPDFSDHVSSSFNRSSFDEAIKKASEEDEEFNAKTRAAISSIMKEENNSEIEEKKKDEEMDSKASLSLKSWLLNEENS